MSIGSGSRIYQVAPGYTDTGIRPEDNQYYTPALFSPQYLKANQESTSDDNDRPGNQSENHAQEAGHPKKTLKDQSSSFPEIFNLIEAPDFKELFLLSLGKNESRYKLLIRKNRRERGVTSMLPFSHTLRKTAAKIQQSSCVYLTLSACHTSPKGQLFRGTM